MFSRNEADMKEGKNPRNPCNPRQSAIQTKRHQNYVEQGIRFIRTTDITEDGGLIDKGVYLETGSVEEIYLTQPNDFLISRSGTLGRTYLHQSDEKHTYGGYLVRFNFGCSIKSRFIFYFTKSRYFEYWITLIM